MKKKHQLPTGGVQTPTTEKDLGGSTGGVQTPTTEKDLGGSTGGVQTPTTEKDLADLDLEDEIYDSGYDTDIEDEIYDKQEVFNQGDIDTLVKRVWGDTASVRKPGLRNEKSYEAFIEDEKVLSECFNKTLKIERVFRESSYSLVRELWGDKEMIDKLFEVVDKLLKKKAFSHIHRSLVVGDFLLTFFDKSVSIDRTLNVTVLRSSFISRIYTRCIINTLFGVHPELYLNLQQKLIIGLRKRGVLKQAILRNYTDAESNSKSWTTVVLLTLKTKEQVNVNRHVQMAEEPLVLKYINRRKYCIDSFRNLTLVVRKKRTMELLNTKVDTTPVKRAITTPFKISREVYELSRIEIENDLNELLASLGASSIEEYYKRYNDDSESGYKDVMYKRLHNSVQKLSSHDIIKSDIYEKRFYIPAFDDLRSRLYYDSKLSPTFNKVLRNLYMFWDIKKFENLESSEFYRQIIKYSYLLKGYEVGNNRVNYCLLVIFIQVGKYFIKKENRVKYKTEDIINYGMASYETKKTQGLDLHEVVELNNLYARVDKLVLSGEVCQDTANIVISKDATASGLQNYGIIKGYNLDKLELLNLNNSDFYCDTYQYLIEKYLKLEPGYEKYRKRKLWKSTIMTIPYHAGHKKCFEKFKDNLKEMGVDYNTLEAIDKKSLAEMYSLFYWKIREVLTTEFYLNNDDGEVRVKYNKIREIPKYYKVTFEGLRDQYTKKEYEIIGEDVTKRDIARMANNMHYYDARLMRHVAGTLDVISIHDCFMVRLCDLHKLVDSINDYYAREIGVKTYSIYVVN